MSEAGFAAGAAPERSERGWLEGVRCLVTGGLGFIGSNLALALADAGAHVRVVDAMIPTHGANPHNLTGAARPIDVLEANIADVDEIAPATAEAELVFNLAGQISHVDSMQEPLADFEWNARSHLAFLELLRAQRSRAVVVYTSTRQIYGRPLYLPVDEGHPVQPVDVNGISQHAAEQFHLLYARVHGLRACSLRLTNVYGPRLRLRDSRQGVLAVFLQRALTGQPIEVYGDGAQIRDFLHVDDVVEALLLAARMPAAVGEAFNVSHDESTSLASAAEAIAVAAGQGGVDRVAWPSERAAIDIGDFVGDFSKARRVLGWSPRIAFADGIRSTVAFYREHGTWYL